MGVTVKGGREEEKVEELRERKGGRKRETERERVFVLYSGK